MEEKLYFKPDDYGKGKKKKRPERKDGSGEKKNHRTIKIIGILLFLLALTAIIIWLLRGKTTTNGQYPANITNESLNCSSLSIEYPKISRRSAKSTELKMTMVFSGTEKLVSGSLRYILRYDNHSEAVNSEAVNHANFGTELASRNLKFTEFDNKFTILDNVLEVSLRASASSVNEFSADFFLIDTKNELPKTLEEYRKNYESQGFTCETSKE